MDNESLLRMRTTDKMKLISAKPVMTTPVIDTIDLVRSPPLAHDTSVDSLLVQVSSLRDRTSILKSRLLRKQNLVMSKLSLADNVILEDAITRNQIQIDETQSRSTVLYDSIRLYILQKKELVAVLQEDEDVNTHLDMITKDIARMEQSIH